MLSFLFILLRPAIMVTFHSSWCFVTPVTCSTHILYLLILLCFLLTCPCYSCSLLQRLDAVFSLASCAAVWPPRAPTQYLFPYLYCLMQAWLGRWGWWSLSKRGRYVLSFFVNLVKCFEYGIMYINVCVIHVQIILADFINMISF
jgi:hypothetical protein